MKENRRGSEVLLLGFDPFPLGFQIWFRAKNVLRRVEKNGFFWAFDSRRLNPFGTKQKKSSPESLELTYLLLRSPSTLSSSLFAPTRLYYFGRPSSLSLSLSLSLSMGPPTVLGDSVFARSVLLEALAFRNEFSHFEPSRACPPSSLPFPSPQTTTIKLRYEPTYPPLTFSAPPGAFIVVLAFALARLCFLFFFFCR